MKQFSYLFSDSDPKFWVDKKNYLKSNIDLALERGKCDQDVLLIMKDILDDIKICTSVLEYADEVIDG